MPRFDPDKHHRRSIRLQGYNYASPGAYFVTICTQNRECLFGTIADGIMHLSDAGQMVRVTWDEMPCHYPGVGIDAFVVMPNHVHGIIMLHTDVGATPRGRPETFAAKSSSSLGQTPGRPRGVAPTMSLSDVVYRFKSLTTARYMHGVNKLGWLPFDKRLWQRNYYEHIIRDERELDLVRQYIVGNPAKWEEDTENPRNLKGPTL